MYKKNQKLAFFLFRENVKDFSQCVGNWNESDKHDIDPQYNIDGKIIIGEKSEESPAWVGLLQQGTLSTIDTQKLINSSSRAVILIKIDNRFLAISFGYGRYLLNDEYLDRTFGLKVVLNTVNHKKLKTVELATLSDNTVVTKKQSTRSSSKEIFGIELLNDLLCAVSGELIDTSILGKTISGREQLILSPKMDFTNLKDICEAVLVAYNSDSYKSEFSWIDDIAPVKDHFLTQVLDQKLLNTLINRGLDYLGMALPEVTDDSIIDGYAYLKKGEIISEPDVSSFLDSVNIDTSLSVKFLKTRKLWIQDTASSTMHSKWRIYDCLHFQTEIFEKTYVLFGGQWYCIDGKFAKRVQNAVDKIIEPNNHSFSCSLSWTKEFQYNQAFAQSDSSQYVLLDMHLVKCENARTTIEPCDVLSADGTFYHIKPKKGSASLSHLFLQGKTSAEAFLKDRQFRIEVRKHIRKEGGNVDIIPKNRPSARNYKIVFGIIDSSNKTLKESLPFFSQLNLMLAYEHLSAYGYQVSAVKIQKQ